MRKHSDLSFVDGYYYDIVNDLTKYPDNWIYIIVGGRNTGKTYSCLKECYTKHIPFVFVKRTIEDVEFLCNPKTKDEDIEFDASPFKPINRDLGCNVTAIKVKKGLGGFYNTNDEGLPYGKPIGYIASLNGVSKIKGFDFSECKWVIFDEFIPQPWERINRREGEQLMDLYKTVSRDREHRGEEALKLICLANATKVSNPVCNILEITDQIVDMEVKREAVFEDEYRGIFVHRIIDNPKFLEKERQSKIYRAMEQTDWGQMALNNSFAYDDFTAIKKSNLKGYVPIVGVKFKSKAFYLYINSNNGRFYMTFAPARGIRVYNLKVENEQKAFYLDYVLDLQEHNIDGRMDFETYSMYDLIVNYKTFFKL